MKDLLIPVFEEGSSVCGGWGEPDRESISELGESLEGGGLRRRGVVVVVDFGEVRSIELVGEERRRRTLLLCSEVGGEIRAFFPADSFPGEEEDDDPRRLPRRVVLLVLLGRRVLLLVAPVPLFP